MREKIKEIQEYFISQIIEGNFQTLEATTHRWTIEIDEEYVFCFWVANGKGWFSELSDGSFMELDLNREQLNQIWGAYNSLVYEKNKEEEKIKRKEQYERLKKEFEND